MSRPHHGRRVDLDPEVLQDAHRPLVVPKELQPDEDALQPDFPPGLEKFGVPGDRVASPVKKVTLPDTGLPDQLREAGHSPGVDQGLVVGEEDGFLSDSFQLLGDPLRSPPFVTAAGHLPPGAGAAPA
jgi:hypothetical protein